MIKKTYAVAAMATIAIGAAVGAVQFTANPAAAQATGPLTAQCRFKDAGGRAVVWIGSGETVLFVPQGSPLMRDRGGAQTRYHPQHRDRITTVELKPGCNAVLYGQFGAAWGHAPIRATGPTGVPANHIGGVKCECR